MKKVEVGDSGCSNASPRFKSYLLRRDAKKKVEDVVAVCQETGHVAQLKEVPSKGEKTMKIRKAVFTMPSMKWVIAVILVIAATVWFKSPSEVVVDVVADVKDTPFTTVRKATPLEVETQKLVDRRIAEGIARGKVLALELKQGNMLYLGDQMDIQLTVVNCVDGHITVQVASIQEKGVYVEPTGNWWDKSVASLKYKIKPKTSVVMEIQKRDEYTLKKLILDSNLTVWRPTTTAHSQKFDI